MSVNPRISCAFASEEIQAFFRWVSGGGKNFNLGPTIFVDGEGHSDVITQSQSGQIDILFFDNLKLVGSDLLPGHYDTVHDVADMKNGSALFLTQGASSSITELAFDGSHIASSHSMDALGISLVHAASAADYFFS